MDLGLVTADIPAEKLEKVQAIAKIDLSRVKARLNVDYPVSPEQLDRFEREVKRFFALYVMEEGPFVISERADHLWHYFLLHSEAYRGFCSRVFGGFLDHIPILPEERTKDSPDYASYLRTKETYSKYFGPPPADLWGESAALCYGCRGVLARTPLH